jgi:hypothetical protein
MQQLFFFTIMLSLAMVVAKNKIDDSVKCRQIAIDLDCHADVAM